MVRARCLILTRARLAPLVALQWSRGLQDNPKPPPQPHTAPRALRPFRYQRAGYVGAMADLIEGELDQFPQPEEVGDERGLGCVFWV